MLPPVGRLVATTINKQQYAPRTRATTIILFLDRSQPGAHAMHLVVVGKSAFSAKIKQIASDANLRSKRKARQQNLPQIKGKTCQ